MFSIMVSAYFNTYSETLLYQTGIASISISNFVCIVDLGDILPDLQKYTN